MRSKASRVPDQTLEGIHTLRLKFKTLAKAILLSSKSTTITETNTTMKVWTTFLRNHEEESQSPS
ncbi:uncharacterized protein G2W53_031664 [Senna tora]|uniref:Uncharacterized protein n=1 Tax=Senna tora TaxID=362788 RepID=A0A834T9K3_9FABA|nr:uncharacterized protein G2W53_031664 [Senna tora]